MKHNLTYFPIQKIIEKILIRLKQTEYTVQIGMPVWMSGAFWRLGCMEAVISSSHSNVVICVPTFSISIRRMLRGNAPVPSLWCSRVVHRGVRRLQVQHVRDLSWLCPCGLSLRQGLDCAWWHMYDVSWVLNVLLRSPVICILQMIYWCSSESSQHHQPRMPVFSWIP